MDDFISFPQAADRKKGAIFLFLSIYLIVFAFFILLVSISTIEKKKQQAAVASVTTTFSNIAPPISEITATSSDEEGIGIGEKFQEEITGVFSTSLRVARVEIIQPGRLMRVQVPAAAMFFDSKAEIRPAQGPLLDRIVLALSARPSGLRHDAELVIGSAYTEGESLPIGQTLELSRAGVLARELLARGAPPDGVAIGVKPGNPNEIDIWFYTRSTDELRDMMGKLGEDAQKIEEKK